MSLVENRERNLKQGTEKIKACSEKPHMDSAKSRLARAAIAKQKSHRRNVDNNLTQKHRFSSLREKNL